MARIARAFGWTMNEVRAHTLRDVHAYADLIANEARTARMDRSRRKAGL